MSRLFNALRQMLTLAILWGFIGVAGYSIFSTLTASPGLSSMSGFPAWNPEAPEILNERPYGIPMIREQHLAANATVYAEIPGAAEIVFNGKGGALVMTETGDLFCLKPDTGERDSIPFLSLARETTDREIGFRAIALHPGFLDPESRGFGRFYTVEPEIAGSKATDFAATHGNRLEHHQEALVEYQTNSPEGRVFNGSRREVLRLSQPAHDHNMSSLSFDRSGRLYIAIGDGGQSVDSDRENALSRHAMELDNVFGKVLRIDPLGSGSMNGRYGIPRRNPFRFLDDALPEVFAYGLRNPRHVEFDMFRNQLCITDAGQDGIEEVNLSTTGGEHFGWDLCEGSFFYPPHEGERPHTGVTHPTIELPSAEIGAMMGSLLYTGHRFPELHQRIVIASQGGEFFAARVGERPVRILLDNGAAITRSGVRTIRSGTKGELFVVAHSGEIFSLTKRATEAKTVTGKVGRRLLALTVF